ncbi:MAG: tetratricopeptide repeat protein [Gallionellaceae bacterium]|nr:tetratricopeptide repeat protein [Gallionellaceae bacterium]
MKSDSQMALEVTEKHTQNSVAGRRAGLLQGLILMAAIVLLYGYSLWNPLVFDDKPFFTEATLKNYGTSLFRFDFRWFSYASFGWTYDLFGLNWFWYRAGNLALHALTCIILFVFFQRLMASTVQSAQPGLQSSWPAFFAVIIFALHPVAVYGVAYLVERSIIMATLFGVASLICYLEGLNRGKTSWFIGSAVCYFLAVFSKEHSVMIPAVAAALTLLLHKPSFSIVKKVWLPFLLYAAIGLLIILRSKGVLGTPYEPFAAEMLAQMSDRQADIKIENAHALSAITQGYLFFKYLLLWAIPYTGWMSVDIRQPFAAQIMSWPELAGFVAFLAYPLLALRLLLKGGRIGLLGFALLSPWLLFLTELSSVRIQEPFVLYRSYLWMSVLPLALLAFMDLMPKKAVPVLFSVLALIVAALAWNRLDTFSSNLKLWSDVIVKNQDEKLLGVERGYNNRGFAHLEAEQLQEAQSDFNKAIVLNPRYPEGHLNIANMNFRQGRIEEAVQGYNKAISFRPNYSEAYLNRGVAYLQAGRHTEAISDFDRILQINSRNEDAYLNRGITYMRLGKTQEALDDIGEAIKLNPKMANAYMNRGILDAMRGRAEFALADVNKAISLDPKNAEIYFNRGIIHGAIGRHQEALQDYSKAIELNPNSADAYVNRGGLYMAANRLPEAITEFNQAIKINPNQENAYLNRGSAFAAQSRFQDALSDFDKVLSLNPKNPKAMLNRGGMLLALNKKKEAMESFRKSCDAGVAKGCEMLR